MLYVAVFEHAYLYQRENWKEEECPEKGKRKKKAPIFLTNEKKTAYCSIVDVSFSQKPTVNGHKFSPPSILHGLLYWVKHFFLQS